MRDVFTKNLARNQGGMSEFLHHNLVVSANNACGQPRLLLVRVGSLVSKELERVQTKSSSRRRKLRLTNLSQVGIMAALRHSIFVLGKLFK